MWLPPGKMGRARMVGGSESKQGWFSNGGIVQKNRESAARWRKGGHGWQGDWQKIRYPKLWLRERRVQLVAPGNYRNTAPDRPMS